MIALSCKAQTKTETYIYYVNDNFDREITIEFVEGEFERVSIPFINRGHWSLEDLEVISECYKIIKEIKEEKALESKKKVCQG